MNRETEKYIRAVAQLRSISKAAKHTGISQPAISAQIRKAEEEFGVTIFDRSSHPLEITQEGELVLKYFDKLDELENSLREDLRGVDSLEHGYLRVGGTSTFNAVYLPQAIKVFKQRYPGIRIDIIDGNVEELKNLTLSGDVDLFISSPTQTPGGLHFQKFLESKIYLCVPQDAKLPDEVLANEIPLCRIDAEGDQPEVQLAAFEDVPFIRLDGKRNLGAMLDQLIAREGLDKKKITLQADQTITSYILTIKGVGASLMSGIDIRNIPFTDHPRFFMIDNKICRREMYLVYREGHIMPASARAFIGTMKELSDNRAN